jgi:1-deoxy-D-xylulose-5-phosphate reductoisomerase
MPRRRARSPTTSQPRTRRPRIARLDFEAPDRDTFACLDLAYGALAAAGSAPIVLNAANEEAVAAFLDGRLPYLAIADVIEFTLESTPSAPVDTLTDVVDVDLTARRVAQRMIASAKG